MRFESGVSAVFPSTVTNDRQTFFINKEFAFASIIYWYTYQWPSRKQYKYFSWCCTCRADFFDYENLWNLFLSLSSNVGKYWILEYTENFAGKREFRIELLRNVCSTALELTGGHSKLSDAVRIHSVAMRTTKKILKRFGPIGIH